MAVKKGKGKPIQFQIGWPGLFAIVASTVCVLLWSFVLGFWMGQKVMTGSVEPEPRVTVYNPSSMQDRTGQEQAEENKTALRQLKKSLQEEEKGPAGQIKTETIDGNTPIRPVRKDADRNVVHKVKGAGEGADETGRKLIKEKIAGETAHKKRFYLQIASYRVEERAEKEARHWEKKGYYVQVKKADLGQKGVWYRVCIGRYRSFEEAKRASLDLASKEGIRSYIVPRNK